MGIYRAPARVFRIAEVDVPSLAPNPPDGSNWTLIPRQPGDPRYEQNCAIARQWIEAAKVAMADQIELLAAWGFRVDLDLLYDPVSGLMVTSTQYGFSHIAALQIMLARLQQTALILDNLVHSDLPGVSEAVLSGKIEICYFSADLEAVLRGTTTNFYSTFGEHTGGLAFLTHRPDENFGFGTPFFRVTDATVRRLAGLEDPSYKNPGALAWLLGMMVISGFNCQSSPESNRAANAATYGPQANWASINQTLGLEFGPLSQEACQLDQVVRSGVLPTDLLNSLLKHQYAAMGAAMQAYSQAFSQMFQSIGDGVRRMFEPIKDLLEAFRPFFEAAMVVAKVEVVVGVAVLTAAGGAAVGAALGGSTAATVGGSAAVGSAARAITDQSVNVQSVALSAAGTYASQSFDFISELPSVSDLTSQVGDGASQWLGVDYSSLNFGGLDMGLFDNFSVGLNTDAVASAVQDALPQVTSAPALQDVSSYVGDALSFLTISSSPPSSAQPASGAQPASSAPAATVAKAAAGGSLLLLALLGAGACLYLSEK